MIIIIASILFVFYKKCYEKFENNYISYNKKFAVVQYDNRELNDDYLLLKKINEKYCSIHNYEYIFLNENYDLPAYWIKVKIVKDLLDTNKYKGILWIDTDAVISNFDIKLENLCIPNKTMYFCDDPPWWSNRDFNAGVWLILNNQYGLNIMHDWLSSYDPKKWEKNGEYYIADCEWSGICYEQGAFIKNIMNKYVNHLHKYPWYYFQSHNIDEKNNPVFTHHFAGRVSKETNMIKFIDQYKNKNLIR